MICNNCIHKELCNEWEQRTEYIKPVKNEICDHFADMSEMIKLPCKIGDMVYWVDVDVDEGTIGTYEIKGIETKPDGFYIVDCDNNIDKIGSEYALLTESEAMAKLAEMRERE